MRRGVRGLQGPLDQQPNLRLSDTGRQPLDSGVENSSRATMPRWLIVFLLFVINLLNYMDRLTIAGIIPELQMSPSDGGFGITDAEAGILSSIFVFTYMLLSPVFGFLGDRVPRMAIMTVGVMVWAASTMLCSFAQSYSQLLVFRSMVGFGEASYATIAPTLIADLYPVEQRATALAFYFVATPLGSALGYLVAGEMAYLLDWRWAFRVTPPLAVSFMTVLCVFVEEPSRGATELGPATAVPTEETEEDDSVAEEKLSIRDFFIDLRLIWRIRSFAYSTLAFTAITFISGALSAWGPAFLIRLNCTHSKVAGRCKSQVNYSFGIIGSITGVCGTLLGAFLSQRYSRVSDSSDSIICAIGTLISSPFIYLAIFLAPMSMTYTWVSIFVAELCIGITWAPVTAMLLYVTQPTQRSFAAGIQTLTSHLFGDALSPIFVGWLADNLYFNDDQLSRATALQYALFPAALFGVVSSFFFLVAARYVSEDRRAVELAEQGLTDNADGLTPPNEAFFRESNSNHPMLDSIEMRKGANENYGD